MFFETDLEILIEPKQTGETLYMNADEKWHAFGISEVTDRLKTSKEGLTKTEAASRLEQYGFNELTTASRISRLTILLR